VGSRPALGWLVWAAVLALPWPSPGQTVSAPTPPATELPQVNVIAPTPLLGSGVDRGKVPAQNQVFTSRDLGLGACNLVVGWRGRVRLWAHGAVLSALAPRVARVASRP
jgi:hypothetical protein